MRISLGSSQCGSLLGGFAAVRGSAVVAPPATRGGVEFAGRRSFQAFERQWVTFNRELDRVRRFDRPLAVVVWMLRTCAHPREPLELSTSMEHQRIAGIIERNAASNGTAPDEDRSHPPRDKTHMLWNIGYALRDLLRDSDAGRLRHFESALCRSAPGVERRARRLAAARSKSGMSRRSGFAFARASRCTVRMG